MDKLLFVDKNFERLKMTLMLKIYVPKITCFWSHVLLQSHPMTELIGQTNRAQCVIHRALVFFRYGSSKVLFTCNLCANDLPKTRSTDFPLGVSVSTAKQNLSISTLLGLLMFMLHFGLI